MLIQSEIFVHVTPHATIMIVHRVHLNIQKSAM